MIRNLSSVVMRLSEGDSSAFREVFEFFSPRVFAFALKLTHSRDLAEELVQDVFLKIWTSRNTLRNVEHFPAYLYTITRNLSFNQMKRLSIEQRAKQEYVQGLRVENFETEESVIYRDYERILSVAIDRLSPQQKLVYSLCRGEGLKYGEAARKLRISPLTVKTHMQQALRNIKLHVGRIIVNLGVLAAFIQSLD